MKKYLLICAAYVFIVYGLAILRSGITNFSEYWWIIFIICIPLILIAIIVTIMSFTLRRNIDGKTQIFQKSFRNVQLALSSAYLLVLLWTFAPNSLNNEEPDVFSPKFSARDIL